MTVLGWEEALAQFVLPLSPREACATDQIELKNNSKQLATNVFPRKYSECRKTHMA